MAEQTRIGIEYVVPAGPRKDDDMSAIFEAINSYQSTVYIGDYPEASVSQIEDESVRIGTFRGSKEFHTSDVEVDVAAAIREGVESRFPVEDRERLSGYFAGIAIPATKDDKPSKNTLINS